MAAAAAFDGGFRSARRGAGGRRRARHGVLEGDARGEVHVHDRARGVGVADVAHDGHPRGGVGAPARDRVGQPAVLAHGSDAVRDDGHDAANLVDEDLPDLRRAAHLPLARAHPREVHRDGLDALDETHRASAASRARRVGRRARPLVERAEAQARRGYGRERCGSHRPAQVMLKIIPWSAGGQSSRPGHPRGRLIVPGIGTVADRFSLGTARPSGTRAGATGRYPRCSSDPRRVPAGAGAGSPRRPRRFSRVRRRAFAPSFPPIPAPRVVTPASPPLPPRLAHRRPFSPDPSLPPRRDAPRERDVETRARGRDVERARGPTLGPAPPSSRAPRASRARAPQTARRPRPPRRRRLGRAPRVPRDATRHQIRRHYPSRARARARGAVRRHADPPREG